MSTTGFSRVCMFPIVRSAYGKTGGVFCARDCERRLIADRLTCGLVFTDNRLGPVNRIACYMKASAFYMSEYKVKTVHF